MGPSHPKEGQREEDSLTEGFRVQAGDEIILSVISSITGTTTLNGSILQDLGETQNFETFVTQTNDRVFADNSGRRPLVSRDGLLFNASISVDSVAKRGQIFARAYIARPTDGRARQFFISDYVHRTYEAPLGVLKDPTDGMGLIVSNEATSTLVNNTALTRTITVPTNARWELYGGVVFQADDVARVVTITADDGTNGQDLFRFHGASVAATTNTSWPSTAADIDIQGNMPVLLTEGDRIEIVFAAGGASAGGTARSSANVEEWIER